MSSKRHRAPVPPGNRSQTGNLSQESDEPTNVGKDGEVSSQQEEPKNRLGDYTGKGEHSIQEPDGKKGSDH